MGRLSSLRIHLTDESGLPRPNVELTVKGYLSVEPWTFTRVVITDANGDAVLSDIRYSTSLEPYIIRTTEPRDPPLQLPAGVEPDPIDPSISLGPGEVGVILDPGTTRTVHLVLPMSP